MGFAISIDRNAEILVDARIRINVDQPPPGIIAVVAATVDGFTFTTKGAQGIMYTLPADKRVRLAISYVDAKGNPAMVDGDVTWDSSDPNVAFITPTTPPDEEGFAVYLMPGSTIGSAQISARADADLGSGVQEVITLLDVTVVAGSAVAGVITPGEAEPIP
jgi:hypothetical protein